MTDREYREQVNRIKKLVKKWKDKLGLGWYRIHFYYNRNTEGAFGKTDYSPKVIDNTWVCAMKTSVDPYYLTAGVECYLPFLKNVDDRDLEEYFLHEIMHIILRPMHSKQFAGEEETVATKLAQAFIWSQK